MGSQGYLVVSLLLLATSVTSTCDVTHFHAKGKGKLSLNRDNFPENFTFGAATASYQVEGGLNGTDKGKSIWDIYTHKYPERIKDHSTGDEAADSYYQFKADVGLAKSMGLDAYRFSFSWSRLLPHGKESEGVSKEGVQYYHDLIDNLLANGVEPYVTLFHWDLPQALQKEYDGFLNKKIVSDFRNYTDFCFREYGHKVKHWITLNEPWTYSSGGYAYGSLAPGRCSSWLKLNCTGGDSGTEPYNVTHYQLLAHAEAVKLYRDKYQARQKGKIGITLVTHYFVPNTSSSEDKEAAQRQLDFMFGWFMHPITFGDYPESMRTLVGDRLPKFTKEESKLLNGSFDFLGLNYYTTYYASNAPNSSDEPCYCTDAHSTISPWRNGSLIGPQAGSAWLFVYPIGFREVLLYIKDKYNPPLIIITENGIDEVNDPTISPLDKLSDWMRIEYHHDHLSYLLQAINAGVNVQGYFVWSLLDNFEWAEGYAVRFGMHYVDFNNGMVRYPKLSAIWFKMFLWSLNTTNSNPAILDA